MISDGLYLKLYICLSIYLFTYLLTFFKVTYSIVAGDGKDYFRIDNETGWVRTKGNNLDYERQRFYVLTIMAADHGSPPQQSTQEYRIAVQDVNEYWPQFVKQKYEFSVKGNASVGTRIGTVSLYEKVVLLHSQLICKGIQITWCVIASIPIGTCIPDPFLFQPHINLLLDNFTARRIKKLHYKPL